MTQPRALAALLILTAFAYAGVSRNAFVYEAKALVAQTDGPILNTLVTNHRPLTVMTLWIDRQVFGLNPAGWHLTNVGLHLINGALVYALASALGVSGVLASGVFLLHPIQSAGVAYLNGRSELLVAMGLLLTILSLVRGWPVGAIFGVVIGVLSHEIIVAVVGLVIVGRMLRLWPMGLAPGVILGAAAASGITGLLLLDGLAPMSDTLDWALAQSTSAWLHLGHSLVPIGFSVEYDIPAVPKALQAVLLGGWLAWPVQIWAWRHRPVFAFGMAWMWLTVLPRLLVPLSNQAYFADHQWYVPFIGLSLAAGALWQEALATRQAKVSYVL